MERIKEIIISPTERILEFMERKGTSLIKADYPYDSLKRRRLNMMICKKSDWITRNSAGRNGNRLRSR